MNRELEIARSIMRGLAPGENWTEYLASQLRAYRAELVGEAAKVCAHHFVGELGQVLQCQHCGADRDAELPATPPKRIDHLARFVAAARVLAAGDDEGFEVLEVLRAYESEAAR